MSSRSPHSLFKIQDALNRRVFLRNSAAAVGSIALAHLHGATSFPNYAPKAKRIIYLFQSGAPSQMDLFDPKPGMAKHRGENLPESIRQGQRLTTMTSQPACNTPRTRLKSNDFLKSCAISGCFWMYFATT